MKVKTVDTTSADRASAVLLFDLIHEVTDLGSMRVLDAFARNGQLTIDSYGKYVPKEQIEAWELGPEHEEALRAKAATVRIGDSYGLLEAAVRRMERYDMVVIDTPQGIHCDGRGMERVEHFDFLPDACRLLNDEGVIVLYVNKKPYNKDEVGSHGYDEYKEYDFKKWMEYRYHYYGAREIPEDIAIGAYRRRLHFWGYDLVQVIAVPCFSDVPGKDPYAFRLALQVRRTGK